MNHPDNTPQQPDHTPKATEEKIEKELDPDTEVHKKGSDLITKVDHHIEVDDEFKKG